MKKNNYLYIIFIVSLIFLSCNKEINDPVEDCTLEITDDSETNPKSETYQAILDKYCKKGLPGLSMAIRTPDEGLWLGASGYARIEDKTEMQVCHLHHSASIAKTYIATAVLLLVEQGKINLDDLAKDYLSQEIYSNISNAEQATIRQLLNHTSGIYNFDDNFKFYVNTFNNPLEVSTIGELFEKYVYDMPEYFSVGEGYHYSNTNYSLLGLIIEKASGITLGEYIEQNIFEPLELTNTFYKNSPQYPDIPNLVNSYFEQFENNLQNCSDMQKHFDDIAYGHEGIIAAPYDFLLFMENLISGNILSAELTQEMINMSEIIDKKAYGLGIVRYETDFGYAYGHTGGAIGTMTYAMYFPDSQVSFVICCNMGLVFRSEKVSLFYEDLFEELITVILE